MFTKCVRHKKLQGAFTYNFALERRVWIGLAISSESLHASSFLHDGVIMQSSLIVQDDCKFIIHSLILLLMQ